MGGDDIILMAWEAIAECFEEPQKTASIAEHRYIQQLEMLCLDLWIKIAG